MCLVQLKISSTSLSARSIVMVCMFLFMRDWSWHSLTPELMFGFVGTAGLSYAEFLHKIGNYPMAKEVYRNVVQGAIEVKNAGRPYLGAGNMSVDELIVGSMFALGQLELLMG